MNIDTDTQWATWEGVLHYYKATKLICRVSWATRRRR
ncbi:hypothetical protein ACNKHW_18310 [Shigella flexneri]